MKKNYSINNIVLFALLGLILLDVMIGINFENIINIFFSIDESLDFTKKNQILERQIIFSAVINNLIPVILAIYSLLLGLDIIMTKRIPPKYIPLPIVIYKNIATNKALGAGITIGLISLVILSSLAYEIIYANKLFG